MSPLQTQLSIVCREGILYKSILARSLRCSRLQRFDEIGIITPVAIDEHVANCLEEAVSSFTAMSIVTR